MKCRSLKFMDKYSNSVLLFTYVKIKKFSNVYACFDSRKLFLYNNN